ncbi:MAG: MBL fold metallo-hydrolase, partial [Chloroflexi bacterium]|nr:MBL fold metallo-hydrolase [Chloroflexota bacterium]
MKIKWLGHASFLITLDSGNSIITDPYAPNPRLAYSEIKESADIVTVSHEHGDHNNVAAVKKSPQVLRNSASVKGINFKAVQAFHDTAGGQQRGKNTIFCIEAEGLRICHLGDLGHSLSSQQIDDMGRVDVLFVPVGGNYTIDAQAASELVNKLGARIVIPMHYKTDRCPEFPV